jgi:hypothetical protein
MRCLGVFLAIGACGGNSSPTGSRDVTLTLAIPGGTLDPKGYTSLDLVLHGPAGDVWLSSSLGKDPVTMATGAAFSGIDLAPGTRVSIEATLRNDTGVAVGYGRTAVDAALIDESAIEVPVRRPIAYIAGAVSRDADGRASTPALHWTEAPATYADLAAGTRLDGKTQVGLQPAVLMIGAGPSLYMVTQAITDPNGVLNGPAKIVPISPADHQALPALDGTLTGAVADGAGADDGSTLVIATSTQLFAIKTAPCKPGPCAPGAPVPGMARPLTDGNFARVAVVTSPTGEIDAIAIKNRESPTTAACSASELWWVPVSPAIDSSDPVGPPQKVASGGFCDIATDRGHAYYVDAVKGDLGEVAIDGGTVIARSIRILPAIAGAANGKPTALAVSNGQAYVGIESPPATTSLLVVSTTVSADREIDQPRTLWSEAARQVVRATDFAGVQRQLDASSAAIDHIEIGAGDDYIALTTSAHFEGEPILAANFPGMTIDTEELHVFDASSGGVVQRYRSWCAGVLRNFTLGDIENWSCAAAEGQTAAARDFDHHINSMTFLFGKK